MSHRYDSGTFDADWWAQHGRSVKARLTRAERIVRDDPRKAWAEADAVDAIMTAHGYPDWWSRVDRLATDALFHLARTEAEA